MVAANFDNQLSFFWGTCSTKLGGYQSGVDIIIDVSVGFLLQLGLTGDESPTDVNASAEISRVAKWLRWNWWLSIVEFDGD